MDEVTLLGVSSLQSSDSLCSLFWFAFYHHRPSRVMLRDLKSQLLIRHPACPCMSPFQSAPRILLWSSSAILNSFISLFVDNLDTLSRCFSGSEANKSRTSKRMSHGKRSARLRNPVAQIPKATWLIEIGTQFDNAQRMGHRLCQSTAWLSLLVA